MAIKVLAQKCKKNHACPAVAACPVAAITQKDEKSAPSIDTAKCIECQMCITTCPQGVFALDE